MTQTLKLRKPYFKLLDASGNRLIEHGILSEPEDVEITLVGERYTAQAIVADNYGQATLWQTGDGGLDIFKVLWIETDATVFVELRNTQATDEFVLLEVTPDHPLILTSDDIGGFTTTSRIDGAEMTEATDFDQTDQIKIQRNVAESEGDATVTLFMFN